MMHTVKLRWEYRKDSNTFEVGAVDRTSAVHSACKLLRKQDGKRPHSIVVESVEEGRPPRYELYRGIWRER